MAKNGVNEYDVTAKFINDDEIMETDNDTSFYLKQNSKRRIQFYDEQEAGPSSKKSKLERIIENYEVFDRHSLTSGGDEDGQRERGNNVKPGREKTKYDDFDDIEVEEEAELNEFATNSKVKEYTYYLTDYAEYDVFEPNAEDVKSKDFKVQNVFRRRHLTNFILKSILGAIYEKQHVKGGESYLDFLESLRNGFNKEEIIKFQFEVMKSFSKTTIKGCYFNEVLKYVKSIEHAMNKTLYLSVLLEQMLLYLQR